MQDISSSTVEARRVTTACSDLIASFKRIQNHINSIHHLKSLDSPTASNTHTDDSSEIGDDDAPSNLEIFPQTLHKEFLTKPFLLEELPKSLNCLSSSLVWIIYWCLHGLYLMGESEPFLLKHGESLIEFISSCQDPEQGGFGGGPGQLPHIVSTYAAIASLVIVGSKDAAQLINRENLRKFILNLRTPEGKFTVHSDGEFDMRGMYCAVASASMAGIADDKLFEGVGEYIASCQRYDGGIAGERGGESHAGFTFCGLAALSMLDLTELLDLERLLVWLSNRQTIEGGFNGRPEKVVDACYSFWASACFPLIKSALFQRCSKGDDAIISYPPPGYCWMSPILLEGYVLLCCQPGLTKVGHISGGICDKPGTAPDFYHTCYGLSGLSIVSEWCAAEIEQLQSIGVNTPGSNGEVHPIGPLGDMILRGSPKLEKTCPLFNVGLDAQKRYNKTCQELGICGISGKGVKAFERFRNWESDPDTVVPRDDSTPFSI